MSAESLWLHIGNQTAPTEPSLVTPFDFAVANGFDAFEFFPDRLPEGNGRVASYLGAPLRQQVRARARDVGMRLSVHAPAVADPLRPGGDRDLEDSLRLAVDLGAGILNVHFNEPRRTEEFATALLSWLERCAICGIRLAVENLPHVGPDDINRLFALLPRGATAGMTFDVGHANLHPATRNDYIAYLDRLRPEVPIAHVHLHENWGDGDSHLVVFTGPAGRDPAGIRALFERLRRRGFSGNVVLEQWPQPPEMLVEARNRLADLIGRDGS